MRPLCESPSVFGYLNMAHSLSVALVKLMKSPLSRVKALVKAMVGYSPRICCIVVW